MVRAVDGAHPGRRDLGDARRLERHVLAVEGLQVLVVEARPLAAEGVGRRELRAGLGIVDLAAQEPLRQPLPDRRDRDLRREVGGDREGQLDVGVARHPRDAAGAGHAAQHRARCAPDPRVGFRQAPDRGALEDRQPCDVGRDRRDHLHRRRARADHGHALAGEVDVVVPAGGVHRRAREVVQARDGRDLRLVEDAGGADDVAGEQRLGVLELDAPEVAVLVERRGRDAGVQADPVADAEAVDAVLRVGLQLAARRVDPRPARPLPVGELVAERRDVDRDAGIRVPVPRAADAVAGLEHEDVVLAGVLQRDRGADAGEAGADDDHLVVGGEDLGRAHGVLRDVEGAPDGAQPTVA
ncbi:unannotated protein [freshwater metagenome]|uniref:Unannotated protein n=1 Tax=freshwater metagenome TaxID=449393 RepID=A0A6J7KT62_9ZZZZ